MFYLTVISKEKIDVILWLWTQGMYVKSKNIFLDNTKLNFHTLYEVWL
jgi:hypothetical protein